MENEKFYKSNRKTNIDSVASSEHGDTAKNEQKLMAEMNQSGLQQMDSVDDETLRGEESFVFVFFCFFPFLSFNLKNIYEKSKELGLIFDRKTKHVESKETQC